MEWSGTHVSFIDLCCVLLFCVLFFRATRDFFWCVTRNKSLNRDLDGSKNYEIGAASFSSLSRSFHAIENVDLRINQRRNNEHIIKWDIFCEKLKLAFFSTWCVPHKAHWTLRSNYRVNIGRWSCLFSVKQIVMCLALLSALKKPPEFNLNVVFFGQRNCWLVFFAQKRERHKPCIIGTCSMWRQFQTVNTVADWKRCIVDTMAGAVIERDRNI